MENSTHTNPVVSILSGSFFGVFAFISEHGFIFDDIFQVMKVVAFGLIGGACGYIGKNIAIYIHKKLKKWN